MALTNDTEQIRAMWVWETLGIISDRAEVAHLLATCAVAAVTDLYLYMDATHIVSHRAAAALFNAQAHAVHLRVWALEGGRCYFSDADGPAHFYQAIANMIEFNLSAASEERFHGFAADLEPHCPGGRESFHNGIKDSSLSSHPGTGLWKSSQADDRKAILSDWLTIHRTARSMLNASGMRLAGAFPHWTSNYFGEPLHTYLSYDQRFLVNVTEAMMECVDDYIVMSYHTEPSRVLALAGPQADYASMRQNREAAAFPLRILAAVEVTPQVGVNISYADTPGKCSKRAVLQDIDSIAALLGQRSAFFGGMAIHSWSGWTILPP